MSGGGKLRHCFQMSSVLLLKRDESSDIHHDGDKRWEEGEREGKMAILKIPSIGTYWKKKIKKKTDFSKLRCLLIY